jgi:hypothetical protein
MIGAGYLAFFAGFAGSGEAGFLGRPTDRISKIAVRADGL